MNSNGDSNAYAGKKLFSKAWNKNLTLEAF